MIETKDKNLYQKIITVYKEVRTIVKDSEIAVTQSNSYLVVTHDAVTRALHMPIANSGIVCIPDMIESTVSEFKKEKTWNGTTTSTIWYRADVKAKITFVNSDNPVETFSSTASAYAFDTSDKAIGKAYSMAVKTIYLKTFLLESTDEEEERVLEKSDVKDKKDNSSTQQYFPPNINRTLPKEVVVNKPTMANNSVVQKPAAHTTFVFKGGHPDFEGKTFVQCDQAALDGYFSALEFKFLVDGKNTMPSNLMWLWNNYKLHKQDRERIKC